MIKQVKYEKPFIYDEIDGESDFMRAHTTLEMEHGSSLPDLR